MRRFCIDVFNGEGEHHSGALLIYGLRENRTPHLLQPHKLCFMAVVILECISITIHLIWKMGNLVLELQGPGMGLSGRSWGG